MAFQQRLSKLRASLSRKKSDYYNLNKQRQKITHAYRSDNVDETGNNALHLAATEGNYEYVKFFCLNYANVTLPNNDGNDALMLAVIHKHKKIVKYLLSVGAHTYTRNKEGNTAYELVDKNTQKSVVDLILLNRSNAKSRNDLSTQSLTQEAAVEIPSADNSDSTENKKRWIGVKIDETKLENDTDRENGTSFKRKSSKRCEIVRTMYIKSKYNEVYKQETYKKCVDLNQENCQDDPSLPNVFKEHSDTVNKYEQCHDQIDLVEQTTQSVTITQTTLLDTATQSSQTETMSQTTESDAMSQTTQSDVMSQSTQSDAMSQTTKSETMSQYIQCDAMSQTTQSDAMSQTTQSDVMSQSTQSDAMSQTTKSETMSQSIQCDAMSQSTQSDAMSQTTKSETMSQSIQCDTMSQSTQTDEKSQSTQTKAMSQSTLKDGMPHSTQTDTMSQSTQTDTMSQSTQSDYIAQCTQTDAISKSTKTDVISQSTQMDTMSQSTQSDSMAQCAQTDTSHNTIIQPDQSEFCRRSAKDDINLNQSQSNTTKITIKDNATTDQNNENKIILFLNKPGSVSEGRLHLDFTVAVQMQLADPNSFQETSYKKSDGVKRTLSSPAKVSPLKEFQSVKQHAAEKQACSHDQNYVKLKKSISCPSINVNFNTVNITGNDSKTAIDGTLNINNETCDSQL
ncbi:hypothetical protein BgiBS90_032426 [Biomphalaria glabrata]|nr:hypothetical protein BgiBS90_032426 [Biomphalaria glabrata]